MIKSVLIKIRNWVKLFILVSLATFLAVGVFVLLYKPIYRVSINGELLGYCSHKSKLQAKIDNYIENGDESTSNIAFVEIQDMPEYKLCLLKKDIETNDEEIYQKITQTGTPYYKYYTILENGQEKIYVSDFNIAEKVVQILKDKDSENIDNIQIFEKYDKELAKLSNADEAVSALYKEKKIEPVVTKVATTKKSGTFTTATNISKSKVSLGEVSLIRPITGKITSRFGAKSSIRSSAHTGLDIGASSGASIKAASSGTVIFAGYKGSYGNLVVVSHSDSVQTYYGHCSKVYVSSGQKVTQGETIAAVGSTGNSTGPHLHFEIRVNGVAYNPQNYVY